MYLKFVFKIFTSFQGWSSHHSGGVIGGGHHRRGHRRESRKRHHDMVHRIGASQEGVIGGCHHGGVIRGHHGAVRGEDYGHQVLDFFNRRGTSERCERSMG